MGGQPSNARIAMFELCRALHERQDALGYTKTPIIKADGTSGTSITMDDLQNIRCSGENSYAEQNLGAIRGAIIQMVGGTGYSRFTTTSGGTTLYTKAQLETDIGFDLDSGPTRAQQASFWQGLQDAFDRLIYGHSIIDVSFSAATENSWSSGQRAVANSSDYELLWDDRNDLGTATLPGHVIGWYGRGVSPSGDRKIEMGRGYDGVIFPTGVLDGSLVSASYNYNATLTEYTGSGFSVDFGGDGATVSASGTGSVTATGISLGTNTSIDIVVTESEPSSIPFVWPRVALNPQATVLLESATIYHDLATILTDQA